MRKLWRRLVFALTPEAKRLYSVQVYSISRGEYATIFTGPQREAEHYAYVVRFGIHLACRVIRIK